MYSKLGNFIDGQWSNNTKEKIDVINPFNEEVLGQIPVSTKEDLDQALESAKKSFQLWKQRFASATGFQSGFSWHQRL